MVELEDLCAYYLKCLQEDRNGDVYVHLDDRDQSYIELSSMESAGFGDQAFSLVRKISTSKKLFYVQLGYPVMAVPSQEGWRGVPVFLFGVDVDSGSVEINSIPGLNPSIINQFTENSSEARLIARTKLEEELGLADSADSKVDLKALVKRLQEIRTWQWKEEPDPDHLSAAVHLRTIRQPGIYNKAILMVAEKSPYTIGLSAELMVMMDHVGREKVAGTALGTLLGNEGSLQSLSKPLLEVLPLNTEQRQAVRCGLTQPLTVVTGPPGTGKSQVVVNLLINAIYNGKNVLFASKNNKAVDVVEERINGLSQTPTILRIGGGHVADKLAKLAQNLLSNRVSDDDRNRYEAHLRAYNLEAGKLEELDRRIDSLIQLRNETDTLEQRVCELRPQWGFLIGKVPHDASQELEEKYSHVEQAFQTMEKATHSLLNKILKREPSPKHMAILSRRMKELKESLRVFDMHVDDIPDSFTEKKQLSLLEEKVELYEDILETLSSYQQKLDMLQYSPSLSELEQKRYGQSLKLACMAKNLWRSRTDSLRVGVTPVERQSLTEFLAAMKLNEGKSLVGDVEFENKLKQLLGKMEHYFPCWAVTSLSAHGRIPFVPASFDLIVIDEASQCDIASALPLLYRAKNVVVIGDAKQLGHITQLSRREDWQLLKQHHVPLSWSYATSSLYDLAASIAPSSSLIALRDHHRSCKDIIEYSNDEFYQGNLRVATDYRKLNCPQGLHLGIIWKPVTGEAKRPQSGSLSNEKEVDSILNCLAYLDRTGYTGTVGVASPFHAQVALIRQKLAKETPELYDRLCHRNELIVDSVHGFQGDEKDVIVFSPVVSNGAPESSLRFLKQTGNIFNVAVTRAKSCLIVIGNPGYCLKSGIPYLEHFVQYVQKLKRAEKENEETPKVEGREYPHVSSSDTVSEWERLFYTQLYDAGIRTIPQYPIDKYKLDFAIITPTGRKLDIEIDGLLYHQTWTGELCYHDQLRNQRLFELGWDVQRFWVYQIRDRKDWCIDQIRQWVEKG